MTQPNGNSTRKSLIYKISNRFGLPEIDLFASYINRQLPLYVAWLPEPEATSIDAFSLTWNRKFFYIFPPFSVVGRVLKKILKDQTKAILVLPHWPSQPWFPLLKTISTETMIIPPNQMNLRLNHKLKEIHPLSNKLKLLAIKVG